MAIDDSHFLIFQGDRFEIILRWFKRYYSEFIRGLISILHNCLN